MIRARRAVQVPSVPQDSGGESDSVQRHSDRSPTGSGTNIQFVSEVHR